MMQSPMIVQLGVMVQLGVGMMATQGVMMQPGSMTHAGLMQPGVLPRGPRSFACSNDPTLRIVVMMTSARRERLAYVRSEGRVVPSGHGRTTGDGYSALQVSDAGRGQ